MFADPLQQGFARLTSRLIERDDVESLSSLVQWPFASWLGDDEGDGSHDGIPRRLRPAFGHPPRAPSWLADMVGEEDEWLASRPLRPTFGDAVMSAADEGAPESSFMAILLEGEGSFPEERCHPARTVPGANASSFENFRVLSRRTSSLLATIRTDSCALWQSVALVGPLTNAVEAHALPTLEWFMQFVGHADLPVP
jgi:hypothetical protein